MTQPTQTTQPPAPSDGAETFLLELRAYGEAQARLRNLQRVQKGMGHGKNRAEER